MEFGNTRQLLREEQVENDIKAVEGVVQEADPLALEIDEEQLVKIIDKKVKDSREFFKDKYKLYERRKKNETYLFGRQIDEAEKKNELKVYEARYLDNALYEIEASIKPLAMNRLPDMIVLPAGDSNTSKDTAKNLTKIVDSDIKKRENRVVLGIGFKHLPVYFTGIIKARWNPELGEHGDYCFEIVHPDNVDVDHTAASNKADDMNWISHILPLTIQEVVMRFPDKKAELFKKLQSDGVKVGEDGEFSQEGLATEIKIREIWFTWYKPGKEDNQWERVEGVMWKYSTLILKKIRNPNYDYEGVEKWFSYADPQDKSTKREITLDEAQQAALTGILPSNAKKETVYRNFFENPCKPFFFMGYDQWHKIPYDETSRIEQNIRNQENLDKRGKQIVDTLMQRIKHIFSKDSGLKADDIEKLDLDDPRQDLLIDGKVAEVHAEIRPERPTAPEFKDLQDTRDRMYAIAGATAVRGQLQSEVATSNQIAREADFTRADDLVEDTINAASEWMAQWVMQFIKLRYTDDHFRKVLGTKGVTTQIKLQQDMIEDGMEVTIKSSGTDKLRAQKNALDMAKINVVDPLTFFQDMGLDDPEGRTEKLMLFTGLPAMYVEKFVQPKDVTTDLVDKLLGPGASQVLGAGGQPVVPGAPVPPAGGAPVNPTPANTTAVPPTLPAGPPTGSPRVM